MKELTVCGVKARLREDGVAELDLECVARGLGFTQEKNGVEYVRWETVKGRVYTYGADGYLAPGEIVYNESGKRLVVIDGAVAPYTGDGLKFVTTAPPETGKPESARAAGDFAVAPAAPPVVIDIDIRQGEPYGRDI